MVPLEGIGNEDYENTIPYDTIRYLNTIVTRAWELAKITASEKLNINISL